LQRFFAAAGAKVLWLCSRKQEGSDEMAKNWKSKRIWRARALPCNVGKMGWNFWLGSRTYRNLRHWNILITYACSYPKSLGRWTRTQHWCQDFDRRWCVMVPGYLGDTELDCPLIMQALYFIGEYDFPEVSNANLLWSTSVSIGGISPNMAWGIYSVSKLPLISVLTKVFAKVGRIKLE